MKAFVSRAASATLALSAAMVLASAASAGTYGAAGCGLGSMIIGDGDGFSQVFAGTTNGTSWSQTFGITSGTSNCDGTAGDTAATRLFIETNREALATDMSRGSGETIATLSKLAGCDSAEAVGTLLQSEFRSVIPSAETPDAAVGESIVDLLRRSESLSCQSLS